ncbi:MAG TPA: protoheme IX farnesyltransferase [Caldithrix abyssi]|uniref:Protoheme IX farnesyltransferase n=1 Tax=Caldithrix abyssi TaxID=187145 RepID=A0A7V4TXC8_CALAY|nr:protoheme IX farnesyltransferase [Caldithrix abyssi]
MLAFLKKKFTLYWPLIKSLQTGLLLVTGFTGYVSANCPVLTWDHTLGLLISLFLTVSGSTVLNMVYDRDIDAKMKRTAQRPLPAGKLSVQEALTVGLLLSSFGMGLAFALSELFGWVVFAGWFLDVLVYTVWLKRRTAWSIVWGGISGGMPILAGRVLAVGEIDLIGILLTLAILLWIPTHILTFSMRYYDDYQRAGVPTFPSSYGYQTTRVIIALSSLGAALSIGIGAVALGLAWGYLRLLAVLTMGIIGLSLASIYKPSERVNFGLFKFASLYMLSSMLIFAFGVAS